MRPTILVVEDNPTTRKLYRTALETEGYRVLEAADGAAALALANSENPALILQDFILPDIAGRDLARRLRACPGGETRPIVALSGFHRLLEDARGGESGFDEALIKPVDLASLLDVVRRHLGEDAVRALEPSPHSELKPPSSLLERSAMQTAQLSILGGIADALARSSDPGAVLGDVLASCLDAGGISKGALFQVLDDGSVGPMHWIGFSEIELLDLPTLFGHSSPMDTNANARPLALDESALKKAGLRVAALFPCLGDAQPMGALLIGSQTPAMTEEDLLSFGRPIATYVGQAMLLERTFRALSRMAEATERLFSSLEVRATLEALAGVLIPRSAEFCAIHILDGHNQVCAHFEHVHPEATVALRRLGDRLTAETLPAFLFEATDSKRAQVLHELTPEHVGAFGDPYRSIARLAGVRCLVTVPLMLRGHALGVVVLGRTGRRPFKDGDVAWLQELANRAAMAIDHARLHEKLREASSLKDEFLATVSHELRTPLNAMLGWARLMKQERLDETKQRHALDVIERNAMVQAQLVEDLLDISAVISGKLTVEFKPVDLERVVGAAVDSLQPAMTSKGISFDLSMDPAATGLVGDPGRLQQIVWNLLSNAVKFTPSKGAIRLDVKRLPESVEIIVTDSGNGIEPHFLPYVFERFRQADGGPSRRYGGLGLGLSICKDLVALHGGTLRAHSDGAGRGSTFGVSLPTGRSAARPVVLGSTSSTAPPPPGVREGMDLRGIRVLIVEDEEDAREMIGEVLKDRGASIFSAATSADAVELLKSAHPDVLLADIGLPDKDGYELIGEIRKMSGHEGGLIPAAALTAYTRPKDRERALNAGFHIHVPKPLDLHNLIGIVATLARMASGLKPPLPT